MFRLLAFLGLVFGNILSRFTKDELEAGKKYFDLMERVVLFVVILLLLYVVDFNVLFFVFVVFGFVLAMFFWNPYLFFGLSLVVNSSLLVGLVFLYGLPYGTLRSMKKILFDVVGFLVGFGIAYFVGLNSLILGLVSGALFFGLLKR